MKISLTNVEQEYYDAILVLIDQNKVFPTIRDIMEFTGRRSPMPVQEGLKRLIRKGRLFKYADKGARCYGLTETLATQSMATTDNKGRALPLGSRLCKVGDQPKGYWIPGYALEKTKNV